MIPQLASLAGPEGVKEENRVVRFGVMTDVHKDVMHDADHRLEVFISRMIQLRPDFVIQMGDFCIPIPENQGFLDIWKRFDRPRHHVLGNHDMDGDGRHRPDRAYAFTPEETMAFWGMQKRYYSFDVHGVHIIVLDGNERGPEQKPYYRYVLEKQAEWLRRDLAGTPFPTLVFIHQSLEREDGGVANQGSIRSILEQSRLNSGEGKVIACFSGHHHRDYVRRIRGILYPQINSMSYHWLGGKYAYDRYGPEIAKRYPDLKYTAPYKDPLYALVTLDRKHGFLQIEGIQSEFVGPSPWELGASREQLDDVTVTPRISDWKM
jgi:predicted phosphodiesterase